MATSLADDLIVGMDASSHTRQLLAGATINRQSVISPSQNSCENLDYSPEENPRVPQFSQDRLLLLRLARLDRRLLSIPRRIVLPRRHQPKRTFRSRNFADIEGPLSAISGLCSELLAGVEVSVINTK